MNKESYSAPKKRIGPHLNIMQAEVSHKVKQHNSFIQWQTELSIYTTSDQLYKLIVCVYTCTKDYV